MKPTSFCRPCNGLGVHRFFWPEHVVFETCGTCGGVGHLLPLRLVVDNTAPGARAMAWAEGEVGR